MRQMLLSRRNKMTVRELMVRALVRTWLTSSLHANITAYNTEINQFRILTVGPMLPAAWKCKNVWKTNYSVSKTCGNYCCKYISSGHMWTRVFCYRKYVIWWTNEQKLSRLSLGSKLHRHLAVGSSTKDSVF